MFGKVINEIHQPDRKLQYDTMQNSANPYSLNEPSHIPTKSPCSNEPVSFSFFPKSKKLLIEFVLIKLTILDYSQTPIKWSPLGK